MFRWHLVPRFRKGRGSAGHAPIAILLLPLHTRVTIFSKTKRRPRAGRECSQPDSAHRTGNKTCYSAEESEAVKSDGSKGCGALHCAECPLKCGRAGTCAFPSQSSFLVQRYGDHPRLHTTSTVEFLRRGGAQGSRRSSSKFVLSTSRGERSQTQRPRAGFAGSPFRSLLTESTGGEKNQPSQTRIGSEHARDRT